MKALVQIYKQHKNKKKNNRNHLSETERHFEYSAFRSQTTLPKVCGRLNITLTHKIPVVEPQHLVN